jgi:hypothetical protein
MVYNMYIYKGLSLVLSARVALGLKDCQTRFFILMSLTADDAIQPSPSHEGSQNSRDISRPRSPQRGRSVEVLPPSLVLCLGLYPLAAWMPLDPMCWN